MRRENSKFNAAFVSHEGSRLFNNDYYGSAELNGYACYVIADGLEPADIESQSAALAVQSAIAAFHEHPSIGAGAINGYVKAAHRALTENSAHLGMTASITIAVTDYRSLRYAYAGNSRFCLYRMGRLLEESRDHSLSMRFAERGELPLDKIALHEERNNLARYAGQPGSLSPQISKKIKLSDGDIFVLATRGLWEQCDAGDIKASLESAENEPEQALEGLERLFLDRHPADIDNYTVAVVFVDKVYNDPNKGKKLKKILMIAIPLFVVAAVIVVVLVVLHNQKETKRENMQAAFLSAVEYIEDSNYPRAGEEMTTASDLAKDIRDTAFRDRAELYLKLIDAIDKADELFDSGDYDEAQEAYLTAQTRSRFTDNAGKAYIERRLTTVGGFLSVRDLIALGDTLAMSSLYARAEEKYLSARQLASGIGDRDGRKLAVDSLGELYELIEKENSESAEAADAAQAKSDALLEASDMEAAGDKAIEDRDLTGAGLYYTIARERFSTLEDIAATERIDEKLSALANANAENDRLAQTAKLYMTEGDALFDESNYLDAKVKYISARNIFSQIQDSVSLSDAMGRIEICERRIAETNGASEAQSTSDSENAAEEPSE
jgi:serine/threonine protein phosphatase PrpC